MKKILLFALSCLFLSGISAQSEANYKAKHPYKDWVKTATKFDDAFFKTPEAIRIADNVLLYQQITGGWPKNIYMAAELTEKERKEAIKMKENVNLSTIDNRATITEMNYLARIYLATQDEKYKDAFLRGLQYLFEAQYDNGGWPQFYPRPKGYYIHITYNDDAMINVMKMLRDITKKKAPYTFLPDSVRQQAQVSLDKGVNCILKTQVMQNGKRTVWCAQHDHVTLAPAKARAYELPSLSGQESDDIVLFLMSLSKPTPEMIACVDAAIEWFKESEIKDLKKEYFTNADGKKDYRMVPCTDCDPLWARFYDLDTNRPFFCDRDGVKKYNVAEIGYERRNGYSWYNNGGIKVLEKYKEWKEKLNK